MEYIEWSAFEGCSGFTGDLIIPSSVKGISFYAFKDCSGFDGKLIISSAVKNIRTRAFSGCSGFSGLQLPASLTSIWPAAFSEMTINGDLVIPEGVKTIGASAFSGTTIAGQLFLPEGLEEIDNYAFSKMETYAKEIIIPSTLITIKEGAFNSEDSDYPVEAFIFCGNAPENVVENDGTKLSSFSSNAILYYNEDATGWTSPTWKGYQTEIRTISSYLSGDINGDEKVNNKDVTRLMRYIKYKDVEVVQAALDVNGDGKINNKDITRLMRYIKYKDVEIQ